MTQLRIRLLGSFQVGLDESPITNFESNKVRALLAYLTVESKKAHGREKLAALFWPDMPAKRANSNLSQALYNLRRLIQDQQVEPPYLLRSRDVVQFNPDSDYWLDVNTFIGQLDENRIQDISLLAMEDGRLGRLLAAVDLYRGDFLEGLAFDSSLAFDEWVLVMRQRLQRQMLGGLHLLADYFAGRGKSARALVYTWQQVEMDPLDEHTCRQLMRLLAASDQRNQALAQFERLRVMLSEELNLVPEPETMALREKIRGEDRGSTQLKSRRDNLPAFLTPLIGRQQELAEVQDHLGKPDCRLLTILGPGGSGKTRLALEVARSSRDNFRHGVCFVPLNPVQSPASILPAIVDVLDLPWGEQDNHQAQLTNYLRDKNLLLVLDGFEHLLEGAGLLSETLHQAFGLKILVTSRTRLNIKGEHLYLLAGMGYPQEADSQAEILDADAVQLLLTGLRRSRLEYEPAPDDLKCLLQVCRHVQGMPLGILLAASWGATFSAEEIAGRVSRTLDFLSADWADIPARQRSLRATFDHTWNLLDQRERSIFQSLSVFRGAFTRRAARAVSGASHHELRALVDRSLLWSKSPGWYEVHELLRQYGREKLAQSAQVERGVCDLHSAYFLGQLAILGEELKSAQQVAALSNIDLEHENYRAAWNWTASQGSAAHLARVLEALCLYYDLSLRYPDGESACRAAAEGLHQDQAVGDVWLLQARIFTWQSRFTRLIGELEKAAQFLDTAQTLLAKANGTGHAARKVEAFLTFEQAENHFHNDRASAAGCYQHSLGMYRSLDDAWGTAKALAGLGFIAHNAGTFQEAVEIYSECLDLHRKLGDPRGIANALIELGQNSLRLGLTEQGERYINEGVTVLQQIGDRSGIARGYFELGRYYFWSGDSARSIQLVDKSSRIFEDLGILDQYIFASIGIGLGLSHLGEYTETITRVVKSIPLAQELDARREIGLAHVILGMAHLGLGDFEQAENWALKSVKQYRDINQQDELSLALAILVYTQLGLDQSQQAGLYLCEILQIGIAIGGVYPILYILFAAALLLVDRGEVEKAIEISALAERYPFVEKSRWFEDIAGREIAAATESLPPKVVAAAQERGRGRDFWETAAELLEELSKQII